MRSTVKRRRISSWPAGVAGPISGRRFAIGEITNSPVTNEAANVTSAKTTQSWPQSQLPSIIIPIPARMTTTDAGTNMRSPSIAGTPGEAGDLVGVAAAAHDRAVHLEREGTAEPDHGRGDVHEQQELVPGHPTPPRP